MGIVKDINVKITGQVGADWQSRQYELVMAKLRVICAEYGLELEEIPTEYE